MLREIRHIKCLTGWNDPGTVLEAQDVLVCKILPLSLTSRQPSRGDMQVGGQRQCRVRAGHFHSSACGRCGDGSRKAPNPGFLIWPPHVPPVFLLNSPLIRSHRDKKDRDFFCYFFTFTLALCLIKITSGHNSSGRFCFHCFKLGNQNSLGLQGLVLGTFTTVS